LTSFFAEIYFKNIILKIMELETNPQKVEKAEIVAGIPSFNEADTISSVVEKIDEGLNKYFPERSKVIINSDNNSPDNTKEAFLKTKTKTPKIYISTPPGVKGKGNNLRNLFRKIIELDAKFAMTVDADIRTVTPEWARQLIAPQIKGYNFVAPVYYRHKNDAFITNHLCYPVVYGVLGYDIRQPIGGDMGFSRKLVEKFLELEWTEEVKNYGIDIFMTLNAVKYGEKIAQTNLGVKAHKPSTFKLDNMFLQVSHALFDFLKENKELWQKEVELVRPPLIGEIQADAEQIADIPLNKQEIREKALFEFSKHHEEIRRCLSPGTLEVLERMYFEDKNLSIDIELWIKIIYEIIRSYISDHNKEAIPKSLRSLYYGRVACYLKENSFHSNEETEKMIRANAHKFFEQRDYLLSLLNKPV
jgi:glycosyltransferase involved in cell wall biosynthesis